MKDIAGFKGFYKITKNGKVFSIERRDGLNRKQGGIFLSLQFNKNTGYQQCVLKKDGMQTNKQIHVLVAEAFLSKSSIDMEVNHIDGNKINNNIDNLEWITHSDNIKHQYSVLGRKMSNKHRDALVNSVKGIPHTTKRRINKSTCQSKSFGKEEKILSLRKKGCSMKQIGSELGMSCSAVGRFLRGELVHQKENNKEKEGK